MKVKLGQVVAAAGTPQQPGPLQKLVNVDEFCVGLKYRLAKLAIEVNDAARAFEPTKVALVEKYGSVHKTLDEDGNETDQDERGKSVRPQDETWPAFIEEYGALMEEDVELAVEPVVLPPAADAAGVTAADLMALDGLITVRGEDEPKSGPKGIVE